MFIFQPAQGILCHTCWSITKSVISGNGNHFLTATKAHGKPVVQKVHGSSRILKIRLTYSYYLNGILLRTPENLVNPRISKRPWNKPGLSVFPICTSLKRSRKIRPDQLNPFFIVYLLTFGCIPAREPTFTPHFFIQSVIKHHLLKLF